MFSMIFGIISGALSAFSAFSAAQQQSARQRNQARMLEANAQITRQNAEREAQAARVEAQQQEREKSKLRREYEDMQARNRLALGAGNVDMSSGSALDVSLGNIQNFSIDMGDNAYAAAMKKWEADETERQGRQSARVMEENASWLKRSSGNFATSLLTAGISGLGGFAQGYSLAGGSLSGLFGAGKAAKVAATPKTYTV